MSPSLSDLTSSITVGSTMTFVLGSQLAFFHNLMHPGMRPFRELVLLPAGLAVLVGTAFGAFEVIYKPQVLHKPAMLRYR